MNEQKNESKPLRRFFQALGPAIIVACVVLGPGSILASSKVGCEFGYEFIWLLVGLGLLLVGAIATAARVGVLLPGTPCQELAARLGRPVAFVVGLSLCLVATCFQYSNNLGVLAAIEPMVATEITWQPWLLIGLNLALIVIFLALKKLYLPIERLMMILMGVMVVGFAGNLILAHPSVVEFAQGLIPSLPAGLASEFFPQVATTSDSKGGLTRTIIDPWLAIQGLIVTTFSVGGAFYQAYLVKEKGWQASNLRDGLIDSVAGTVVLVGITLMIMVTSAAVLHGQVASADLKNVSDVARQLEPLFGAGAKLLFCIGIFAGAISSFLVNSMIGGTLLADGVGWNTRIDGWPVKLSTVGVLLVGMLVAVFTDASDRVPLIIFAQAVTVLGVPFLAMSILYLATKARGPDGEKTPVWMLALTAVGTIVVIVFAIRTAIRIYLTLTI